MTLTCQLDATVALLWDSVQLGPVAPQLFTSAEWLEPVGRGRGAAQGREYGGVHLVLRHYRRGGLPARLSEDSYLYTGLERSRPFRELRLTRQLHQLGLPVAQALAAQVVRHGLFYRGDLITARLAADALPELATIPWQAVGETIARFHRVGLDHADLNARNLLVDGTGGVYLIDFDRGRLRPGPGGRWQAANLARLRRSLQKLKRFEAAGWEALLAGYRATLALR